MKSSVTEIAYEVVRSRRKTADIVIERDGSVLVRAPEEVAPERIEDIIESKRHWIYRNLAEWRDLNATRVVREYRNGEGFLYLGRSYRLLLVADQEQPLLLKNGRFCLLRDLVDRGEIPTAQAAFREFYIARGLERLTQRVQYYAPKVGVAPRRVGVRELGHRCASCSPAGDLAFYWKCMMAPPTIIDYIVVHELCHFHHLDYTEAFWNEVDKVLCWTLPLAGDHIKRMVSYGSRGFPKVRLPVLTFPVTERRDTVRLLWAVTKRHAEPRRSRSWSVRIWDNLTSTTG